MATYDTSPRSDPKSKEPGPGLWLSIIVLTLGTAGVTWGGYAAFQSAFELLSVDSFETPGSQSRELDPGEYHIYTRDASVDIFDTEVNFDDVFVTLDQILVVNNTSGAEIAVDELYTTDSLGRSANVYVGTAVFEVTQSGSYSVTIASDGESRAVFGRSIESSLDRVVPWLVMAGIGLFLFALGLVMLIVGMVRRKRHRDRLRVLPPMVPMAAPTAGTPPPIPPGQVDAATIPPAPLVPPPIPTNPPPSPTAPSNPSPSGPPPAAPPSIKAPSPNTRQSESETPW